MFYNKKTMEKVMTGKIKYFVLGMCAILAACTSNGPERALDKMAAALENNNSSAFMAQMDISAYSSNKIKEYAKNNEALSSLNALGRMFGLNNVDDLLENLIDLKGNLTQELERGVASGELMAVCRAGNTPECPWVPSSLRDAKVVLLGSDAAIAKVTTPAHMASWLALQKRGENWLVVGQAVMEDQAKAFAAAKYGQPAQTAPAKPGQSAKPSRSAPKTPPVEM